MLRPDTIATILSEAARPAALEEDLRNGVAFSDLFAEYGFTADGLQLLPNFDEIQRRTGGASKT
jgi:hypothetical protein